jgi:glyoxylase-like metal-dependent hydrolase (beta-lactamase superfamily II)
VVTHPNPDKFNGIPAFKKIGAKVIMSKESLSNLETVHNYKKYYFVEMAKMFTNDSYPKLPTADITFEDNYEIKLANGGKIKLTELHKSGISTNQTIAFIETTNALIVGDLVHHHVHAWLEGPINSGTAIYNNANWIGVLKVIQSTYSKDLIVYGGRGESEKLSIAVAQQIKYLENAEKITKQYLSSIGNDKSKVDYAQLQKEFEKEFPNYSLGYMIAYGAYGIVASLK